MLGESRPNQTSLSRLYIWAGDELVALVHNSQMQMVHVDYIGRPEVVTNIEWGHIIEWGQVFHYAMHAPTAPVGCAA